MAPMQVDQFSEEDDDSVGTDSTIDSDYDSEDEFLVEDILAEGQIDGEMHFLIRWTGYALHDATWEAISNLTQDTLNEWDAKKREIASGRLKSFCVRDWRRAVETYLRRKYKRHEARNRKRRRRNLQPTPDYGRTLRGELAGIKAPDDEEVNSFSGPEVIDLDSISSSANRRSSQFNTRTSQHPSPVVGISRTANLPPPPRRSESSGGITARVDIATPPNPSTGIRKAQRSRPLLHKSRSTTNVFIGGKASRVGRKLEDAARDPRRDPQMLNLRHQRQLEKRSRDADGEKVPIQMPQNLISLDSRSTQYLQPVGQRTTDKRPSEVLPSDHSASHSRPHELDQNGDVQMDLGQQPQRASPPEPKNDKTAQLPKPAQNKTPKVKKTVRINDQVQTREPQETSLFLEDGSSVAGSPPRTSFVHVDAEPDHRQIPVPVQAVQEKRTPVSKGAVMSSKSNSNDFLKLAFARAKPCYISHTRFVNVAMSFQATLPNNVAPSLATFARAESINFTHVCMPSTLMAEQDDGGLYSEVILTGHVSSPQYRKDLLDIADRLRCGRLGLASMQESFVVVIFPYDGEDWKLWHQRTAVGAEHELSFAVLKSGESVRSHALALSGSRDEPVSSWDSGLVSMSPDTVFGVTVKQMLPPVLTDAEPLSDIPIFLAFPPSAQESERLVRRWLCYCDSRCVVKSAQFAGHWSAFIHQKAGIIVFHEDIINSIGRMPRILKLLWSARTHTFWRFNQDLEPLAQSLGLSGGPVTRSLELESILNHGDVFLLTPSFVVAQPLKTWTFLKWFCKKYITHRAAVQPSKLIVPHEFSKWIQLVSHDFRTSKDERSKQTWHLLEYAEVIEKGLETLIKIADQMNQLMEQYADDETGDGPLVLAPEVINASDEQSLVNWLAFFSIQNINRFRRYNVIGSADEEAPLRTCRIKIPKFSSGADSGLGGPCPPEPADTQTSKLFENDEASTIQQFLFECEQRAQSGSPTLLYYRPISYWSFDMAFDFGDYHLGFLKYQDWVGYFHPFNSPSRAKNKNTYVGFFYTIDQIWEQVERQNQSILKRQRRPWLAVLRPVDVHKRPWQNAELLIWDMSSRARFGDCQDIYESQLLEPHQQLIKAVKDRYSKERGDLPLEHVWLGGFDHSESTYTTPLDVTADYLQRFLGLIDRNDIKRLLPAIETKLPERGWRWVTPGDAPVEKVNTAELVLTDEAATEQDGNEYVVCYPSPAGGGRVDQRPCLNRLYEATKHRAPGSVIEYIFPSTMTWYSEQMAAGRGYEHIRVAPWSDIFRVNQIWEAGTTPAANAQR